MMQQRVRGGFHEREGFGRPHSRACLGLGMSIEVPERLDDAAGERSGVIPRATELLAGSCQDRAVRVAL
jgi:hypothetical protein